MQYALLATDKLETVKQYLSSNYSATPFGPFVLVFGHDYAGYTLDGYILPRLAQWGIGLEHEAKVEWYEDERMFALVDDPMDMPADEVWVYNQDDWDLEVGLLSQSGLSMAPPDGYVGWSPSLVLSEVDRRFLQGTLSRWVLDPGFDADAAADLANLHLIAEG